MTQELIGNKILQILTEDKGTRKIKSSFEADSKLIAEIGKDKPNPAGNIASRVQAESGIPNFQIQDSVLVEAEEIFNAGDGPANKDKRANRVKELALVMGHKIMNRLYPCIIESGDNFELGQEYEVELSIGDDEEDEEEDEESGSMSESNTLEHNDLPTDEISPQEDANVDSISEVHPDRSSSVNWSSILARLANKVKDKNLEQLELFIGPIDDNYLLCLRNSIELENDRILAIIQKKAGNEDTNSTDNIKKHASDIARMIVRLSEIASAILYVSNSAMISTGIMQVTIESILIEKASDIAQCVQSEDAEEVAILINTPFYNTSTAQQTIAKAMFGVVISHIIKDNPDEIAGKKYLNQSTIAGNVETVVISRGIMQGYKRRMYMLIALADSIAHNIVIRLINSNILNWNLFQVVSHAIKTIIEENAEDIVGYGSHITAATIQSSFQKIIKEYISDKVNQIFYNLNKSLVIDMKQRPTTDSPKHYQLKLVDNGGQDSLSHAGSYSNITLSIDSGCKLDYGYKCVKHTINLGSSTKATEICGLRLYFGESEVNTYDTDEYSKKFLFYQQSKNYVHVYFYSRTVTTREPSGINMSLLDKAPLLFEYNSQYYRPIDRDNYLNKWIYVNTITGENVGESRQSEQRTNELNNVNKSLNRVDLDQISTFWDISPVDDLGTLNRYLKCYGIPYPGKDPPKGLDKSFYDRICVKPCVTKNYRKQVHSTINKYQIGDICLYSHKITRINNTQPQYNQVEVYYDHGDHHFSRPLLILLTTQGGKESKDQSSATKKWYKRTHLYGKYWAPLDRDETITCESVNNDGYALKDQLEKISSVLYTTLGIDLEQKNHYNTKVTVKIHQTVDSQLKVDHKCSNTAHKVEGYLCCEHNLSGYYTAIKHASKNQQLTFVLEPQIAGIKLGIFTANDTVAPILTYGNTDSNGKKSLVVYFRKGDGSDSTDTQDQDPVPLMFHYNDKYYGPSSKEKYFGHWELLSISSSRSSSDTTELKQKLDQIHQMLNEINLTQTSSYGLRCCGTHPYYYKQDVFNSKRVIVTSYTGGTHKMYVHTTRGSTGIGDITHTNREYTFNAHTTVIPSQKIDQVVVIYSGSTTDKPVLVLLNEAGSGVGDHDSSDGLNKSLTHGYYYTKEVRGDATTEYEFHPITGGCKIMGKFTGQSGGEGDGVNECPEELTQAINEKWNEIINTPMKSERGIKQSEVDTTGCKGPVVTEKPKTTCDRDDRSEDSTDTGSESSAEDRDMFTQEQYSRSEGLSGETHVNDRARVDSTASQDTEDQDYRAKAGPFVSHQGGGSDSSDAQSIPEPAVVQIQNDRQAPFVEKSHERGLQTPPGSKDLLHGSGGVDSGAQVLAGKEDEAGPPDQPTQTGDRGPEGPAGPRGDALEQQQQETQAQENHVKQQQQESQVPEISHGHVGQEHQLPGGRGDGNDRHDGGDAILNRPVSSRGSEASHSAQIGPENDGGGEILQQITEFLEKPEGYGSASAVAGVGLVGTVGAVVYKKCVVASAVAASLAS